MNTNTARQTRSGLLNLNRNLTLNPSGAGGIKITSKIKNGLRFLLAFLFLALLQPALVRAVPTNSPPRVLVMSETVAMGTNSPEVIAALLAIPGCAVDMVSQTNWPAIPGTGTGGPSGFGFDQYRAIVIGDNFCNPQDPDYLAAMNTLNATKPVWTPACSGNVIIMGVDNGGHSFNQVGADKTVKRGIAFAAANTNRTGFYYAMSCFYDYSVTGTTNAQLVPHLTGFGNFLVRSYTPTGCLDNVHMVATHPIFSQAPPLTDAELSNWGCSSHEGFTAWPPNFAVLAIALLPGAFTATDGSNGIPYIVVRGEGVTVASSITLTPPSATNVVGTTHTVCATIATNVSPRVNVPIKFTIFSGPNAVTTYTTNSDANGTACFTYTGLGGPGLDYIKAQFTNSAGAIVSSANVSKLWVNGGCVSVGCPTLQCTADGTWSYSFCVTNLTGYPLQGLSLSGAPAGVSFAPNQFTLFPPLAYNQSTNLAVTITGPVALTNVCFQFGAFTTNEVSPACTVPQCLTLPTCCTRVITNSLIWVSTSGNVSTYNYSITVQNVTAAPVKFVGLGAGQSCVQFLPALLDLTLPAYGTNLLLPGQTRTLNLQVQRTAPCAATNEFYLSTLDTNLVGCCATKYKLPPAKCVQIVIPYNKSYASTNTAVLMKAAPIVSVSPCNFGWVKFYDGVALLGSGTDSSGTGEFSLTVSPWTPGSHFITAVAQLDNGEVESSDPVELIVLYPGDPPDYHGP